MKSLRFHGTARSASLIPATSASTSFFIRHPTETCMNSLDQASVFFQIIILILIPLFTLASPSKQYWIIYPIHLHTLPTDSSYHRRPHIIPVKVSTCLSSILSPCRRAVLAKMTGCQSSWARNLAIRVTRSISRRRICHRISKLFSIL